MSQGVPGHAPARVVGGKRVGGANPNRQHNEDDEGPTAQAGVTQALEPGQQLVAQQISGDMKEKVKHEKAHPVQEPKHDKNYNRAPDVKRTHKIQQPGNHHQ